MTTPKSLFSFPSGEDCYEINTADWVMVSCLNGRTTFQLKTKEFTIDGGKITKDQVKPKADFQAVDSPKKMNGQICFVCFFACHGKQIKLVRLVFGRIYGAPILLSI